MSADDLNMPTIRRMTRVVQWVPRLMEPRAGDVAVDLIPRYARVICVFDEMSALGVRWEDTYDYEIVKRRAVRVAGYDPDRMREDRDERRKLHKDGGDG